MLSLPNMFLPRPKEKASRQIKAKKILNLLITQLNCAVTDRGNEHFIRALWYEWGVKRETQRRNQEQLRGDGERIKRSFHYLDVVSVPARTSPNTNIFLWGATKLIWELHWLKPRVQGCNDVRNHKRSCELYNVTHPPKKKTKGNLKSRSINVLLVQDPCVTNPPLNCLEDAAGSRTTSTSSPASLRSHLWTEQWWSCQFWCSLTNASWAARCRSVSTGHSRGFRPFLPRSCSLFLTEQKHVAVGRHLLILGSSLYNRTGGGPAADLGVLPHFSWCTTAPDEYILHVLRTRTFLKTSCGLKVPTHSTTGGEGHGKWKISQESARKGKSDA